MACGADTAAEPDGGPHSYRCWPGGDPGFVTDSTASIVVGFGEDEFTPVADNDVLTLQPGDQGGFHIELRARAGGLLDFGDPDSLEPDTNPHTRWTARFASDDADAAWPSCPYRRGYAETELTAEADHEMSRGKLLIFDPGKGERLFTEEIILLGEVLDCHGVYGRSEARVRFELAAE